MAAWDLGAKKILVARGMLFYLDTQVKAVPLWVVSSSLRATYDPKHSFKGGSHDVVDFCLGTTEDGTLRIYTVDSSRMIRIFEFVRPFCVSFFFFLLIEPLEELTTIFAAK
jgi:hypothetical protein